MRLIGIDTPESVHPEEERNSDEGKAAANYTKQLLMGKRVYLEYDVERIDDYKRTLAYVYIGDMMVNEHLVKEGYASTMPIEPNTKYKERFELAARE